MKVQDDYQSVCEFKLQFISNRNVESRLGRCNTANNFIDNIEIQRTKKVLQAAPACRVCVSDVVEVKVYVLSPTAHIALELHTVNQIGQKPIKNCRQNLCRSSQNKCNKLYGNKMKKCQVRSLSELALTELANTVVTAIGFAMHTELDNDITITMVDVNSYLEESGATSDIYQDMLRVILSSDFLEATVRFTCLQMLLNGSVQCLVSEIFPYSYYEKILQVIAAQGSGLTALNLKGVWVKHEHMNYMYEIMKNCTKLTKLSIPYIATDELLKYISGCKYLKILDISGETDITEIGVEYLCLGAARERLKIVDIGTLGEENICHTDIALLITNLPNLENLVTYSFVGQSLLCISEHHNPNFKTKLKYLHDTRTNNKTIDAIVQMCPELESIYLDTPESDVMHKLKLLNLRKLKIYKFCCIELEQLLENIGRNLYHLTVIKGRGTMDLGRLARSCSGLIDLDCYMMDLMTYTCDRRFDNLQGLEMLNSPFTNTSLKRFVCNTRTLKRLAIDSITFTDEDMASVFLDTDFNLLEDIWFTSAPNLTVQTVEILMDRCPELQSIGQLSGWALTPDDLSLLRGMLKSANSCLVLSPTNVFP